MTKVTAAQIAIDSRNSPDLLKELWVRANEVDRLKAENEKLLKAIHDSIARSEECLHERVVKLGSQLRFFENLLEECKVDK